MLGQHKYSALNVTLGNGGDGHHPDVKIRVQKEIDEVIPGNRLSSYEDRLFQPYIEAVILEISRLHAPLPLSLPHFSLKDTEVCGYVIPKGCLVSCSLKILYNIPDTL